MNGERGLPSSWINEDSEEGRNAHGARLLSDEEAYVKTLLTGLAMGESPRWHEGRLWLSDWGAQEIIAVDLEGKHEVVLRVPFSLPFCIDWLPDGRLLVVSGREGLLMRREANGSLVKHADMTKLSGNAWNEIVVDGRGLHQHRRRYRSGYSRR